MPNLIDSEKNRRRDWYFVLITVSIWVRLNGKFYRILTYKMDSSIQNRFSPCILIDLRVVENNVAHEYVWCISYFVTNNVINQFSIVSMQYSITSTITVFSDRNQNHIKFWIDIYCVEFNESFYYL